MNAAKPINTDDLRFKIVLTIREWWDPPQIGSSLIDFEGEPSVEQKLYAEIKTRQLAELMAHYSMDDCVSTQGILFESHLWPAVCFHDGDEHISLYVSPYTKQELEYATKQAEEPKPTPVLGNNMEMEQVNMSFLPIWGDKLESILNSMLTWTDEIISPWGSDKVEDRILATFYDTEGVD